MMDYNSIEEKYLKLSELKIGDKNVTDNEDVKVLNKNYKYDLSIIIPVYNAEKYLEKCINSIVNEESSYLYEIVFVNDGSSDKSLDILRSYEFKYNNIVIIDQENEGASAARNHGINVSRGRYVTFIDADDYVDDCYIESMMKNAYSNDADMVKTGYKFINDNGVVVGEFKYKNEVLKESNINIRKIKGHACMCVMKRELFQNLKFPEGFWYEDMIMRFLVAGQCKVIVTLEECLYYYRQFDLSTSKNMENKKQYKCLSQYFLLKQILMKYRAMGLSTDNGFDEAILHEITAVMWLRLRYLDCQTMKDIFLLCCSMYSEYITNKNRKWIYNVIFLRKSFHLWKFISLMKMLKVKLRVRMFD